MKRVALTLLCVVITASVLTSCNTGERPLSVGELLDMGEKYLLDLDYEQAIVCFTWAIEIEPNNMRALMGRGVAYFGLKRYDEAVQDYSRVIKFDAGIAEAYLRLADVYIETGETEEAEKTLRKGLAALPGNAELELKLDGLLRGQGGESGAEPQEQSGAASSTSGDINTSGAVNEGGEDAPGTVQGGIGASGRESAPDRPQYPALPAHLTGQMDAIIVAYEARDEELACNLALELNIEDIVGGLSSADYMYKGVLVNALIINSTGDPSAQDYKNISIGFMGNNHTISVTGWNCHLFVTTHNDSIRIATWRQWTVDGAGNGDFFEYMYYSNDGYTIRERGSLNNYLYHGEFKVERTVNWPDGTLRTSIDFQKFADGCYQALGPPNENGYMPIAVDAEGDVVNYSHPDVLSIVHSVPAPQQNN